MTLSDMKIGTRLYLGFAAVVLLLVVLVTVAYANFTKLSAANDINVHTYQVTAEVHGALEQLINIETGQRGFLLTGNPASLEPYNGGKADFLKRVARATSLTADNPRQQERLQRLQREQEAWMAAAIDPTIALRKGAADGDMAAVVAAVREGKGKKGMDAMRGLIAEIVAAEEVLLAQRAKDAKALDSLTVTTLVGGGVLAAVMAGIIAVWLARNITVPLRRAVSFAQQVAQGDLTAHVDAGSRDEIGELLHALKAMNASLARIVGEVRVGTDTISTASAEISPGNFDLSSRTEQQAGSIEETASSMEELTATVKQNADNARQANDLAATASEVAVRGGAAVSQVVQTMGAINDSAKKIVDIIGVIDGIAFQTNILALNAAVEAARAGEQGRGFAVVASEVRNLAQRSAGAAKEIKALIDTSVEKVDMGTRLVDQAGLTMDEVVGSVRRVTSIISEIANASEEQRAGIEQVNQAITQMDEATQQNAALVEQAAAASASMQDQAVQLAEVVSVFKLDGAATMRPAPVARTSAPPPAVRPTAPRKALPAAQRAPVRQPAPATGGDDTWEEF
ncbi:methyl-accepting chemotaxis protein [Massilia pseudoviolaceinigra]|uniref:methyl-accepting chemotaxis protein n=1 Tax=Massilia pseudoviolaceinigra TaxID=3057165 RepID=UPI002796BA64|nr:methyl-accepting chemotaxis protein [Massilia sp. CCM 9206]MDQ1921771.1 methyl-accepting chemotaxis protein [Massilia sp. CCM 9206]